MNEPGEPDLTIVIPAYNEERKIARDVAAVQAFFTRYALNGELIVVDDGSTDATAGAARAAAADLSGVSVVSYTPNRGKGHALRFGIARARGRNVLFADSGLCVPFEIGTIALTMLDLRMCDIAHGSRRMHGSILRPQPLYRRLGSRAFKLLVHGFMGIPLYISDTQCGFKAYRREVAQHLYGAAFTDGFMFDAEIILRALRKGYRIEEFPVLWSNDADTRFDPIAGTVRNLKELLRIRLGLIKDAPAAKNLAPVIER